MKLNNLPKFFRYDRNCAALMGIVVVCGLCAVGGGRDVNALDLISPGEPVREKIGEPQSLALDQKNWNRPQSVFSWIAMARGYETPWDTVGRQGWMTSDAYVKPVDPGVSEFSSNTQEIYIVFEGQPLDAPGQFAAAWHEIVDGKVSPEPMGKDVIELDMNQKYGYFVMRPSQGTWKKGKYLVKLYYGSPGQDLHAINVIGTMTFTITQ